MLSRYFNPSFVSISNLNSNRNVRLGSEYAGLEFWLSSISCHAPGAPIFVVGTHIDQVSKYSIDQDDLKSRFKSVVGFFFVSSLTYEGIEQLTNRLIEVTLKQSYSYEKIPVSLLSFCSAAMLI